MIDMENTAQMRLMQFIQARGLTPAAFERKCGLSNGYIRNMKKGIGSNKVNDILRTFPELNGEWLMTGEGEMLKPIDASTSVTFGDITGFKQSGSHNTAFSPSTNQGEVESLKRELQGLQSQVDFLKAELANKQRIIEALLNK